MGALLRGVGVVVAMLAVLLAVSAASFSSSSYFTGGDLWADLDMNGNEISDSTGPLQLGGAASTSHGLGAEDAIFKDKVEIDGRLYADGIAEFFATTKVYQSFYIGANGSSANGQLYGGAGQFLFNVGSSSGYHLVLASGAYDGRDYGHASGTDVALYIQSGSSETTWHMKLEHDRTDAVVSAGAGDIKLNDEVEATGISGDGSGKAVCVKSDGNLGTCSDAPNGSGVCTCG